MKIGDYETNEASDQLPLMESDSLSNLIDDIKTNGLRMPIVMHDEQILDGRNRYRACLAAKVKPVFVQYGGDTSPSGLVQYVASMNLARRDLDDGQRAIASRRLVNWLAKQIKGEKKRTKHQPALPGVKQETDEMAESVLADGCAELVAAVDRGEIPLHQAAEVAKLEPEQQQAVVARVAAVEEAPVVRAKVVSDKMESVVVQLSPVDMAALSSGVFLWEKSVHAEVRAAAVLLRKIVPGVRR